MENRATREKKPKPPNYANRAEERGYYRVEFTVVRELFGGGDELDGVVEIKGNILFMSQDDYEASPQRETTVGYVSGFVIKNEDGVDLFYECDAHSQELIDVVSVLFDPEDEELREDVDQALHGVIQSNVIVLDRIEVVPEHRGHGVGLAAASRFLETFGAGCGIAICKPFPLQFEYGAKKRPEWVERMKLGSFEQDQKTATGKLEGYWGRLGFARLLDTPYWAMNLGLVQPTRADLGLE
jgi:hypothetical protein